MTPAEALDQSLLRRLLAQRAHLPLVVLARDLKVTDRDINESLARLRRAGCALEMHPSLGVCLRATGMGVWVDYVQQHFPGDFQGPGRIVEVYRETASTQDAARRLADSRGLHADGAVIAADRQSAGRGRLGRTWHTLAGQTLAFSYLWIQPLTTPPPSVDRLMLATGVAALQAIQQLASPHQLQLAIKWPNDLLLAGQKLAGILVETFRTPTCHGAVIGVGLNVERDADALTTLDPNLRDRMSFLTDANLHVDRLLVLVALLTQLEQSLRSAPDHDILSTWRAHSVLLDQHVALQSNGQTLRGHVLDIDPHLGLIVRTDSGALLHLSAASTTVL